MDSHLVRWNLTDEAVASKLDRYGDPERKGVAARLFPRYRSLLDRHSFWDALQRCDEETVDYQTYLALKTGVRFDDSLRSFSDDEVRILAGPILYLQSLTERPLGVQLQFSDRLSRRNPAVHSAEFRSSMGLTEMKSRIELYLPSWDDDSNERALTNLFHEFGHHFDSEWGLRGGGHPLGARASNSPEWTAIHRNGKKVSAYGATSEAEDFAESFSMFHLDPRKLRRLCSDRYNWMQKSFHKPWSGHQDNDHSQWSGHQDNDHSQAARSSALPSTRPSHDKSSGKKDWIAKGHGLLKNLGGGKTTCGKHKCHGSGSKSGARKMLKQGRMLKKLAKYI